MPMSFVALLNPSEPETTGPGSMAAVTSPHREVLQSIRSLIAGCAHPGCASCHHLAAALDDYFAG